MKTLRITILAAIMALFMIAPAYAALSPNLLVNSDFNAGTDANAISEGKTSGAMASGVWYANRNVNNSPYTGWAAQSSGGIENTRYARLNENWWGSGTVQDYLVQSVQVSQVWPNHVATAGPVEVSFWYIGNSVGSDSYARLYGSDTQPTYGNYGTQLPDTSTSITGFSNTSTWTQKTMSFNAAQGYQWYTIVIYGSVTAGSGTRYFGVDNVSVKVTPIPPAAWLLGTGLLGLIGLRRKFRK